MKALNDKVLHESIQNTAATLSVFRQSLEVSMALIDGGDLLSTFEKVQVGRCRDSLRDTIRQTEDALAILRRH